MQMHQPAGGVVDEDQQTAHRSAIFEPTMLGAVDLDQLADAVASIPGLVDLAAALPSILPQALGDHPAAQRLAGNGQVVQVAELLGRQRRAEIGVPRLDDVHGGLAQVRRRPPVARPATLLRDQAVSAADAVGLEQAPDVALADAQDSGGGRHRQSLVIDVPQNLELRQLHIAHDPHRHRRRLPLPSLKRGRLTALICAGLTFAFCCYIRFAPKEDYRKSL